MKILVVYLNGNAFYTLKESVEDDIDNHNEHGTGTESILFWKSIILSREQLREYLVKISLSCPNKINLDSL